MRLQRGAADGPVQGAAARREFVTKLLKDTLVPQLAGEHAAVGRLPDDRLDEDFSREAASWPAPWATAKVVVASAQYCQAHSPWP